MLDNKSGCETIIEDKPSLVLVLVSSPVVQNDNVGGFFSTSPPKVLSGDWWLLPVFVYSYIY